MNQYNKRIDTLREEMMEHGITIYLILTTDPHQSEYIDPHYQFRTYLTGFTGSNATLLITMNTAVLWTDGRYDVQAKKQLEGTNVELIITSAPNSMTVETYLKNTLIPQDVIGFDGSVVNAHYGASLRKLAVRYEASICGAYDFASVIWTQRPPMTFQSPFALEEQYVGESCQVKCEKIRHQMKEEGATALILSKLEDIMWLLNIRGFDIANNLVAFSHLILEEEKIIFYTNRSVHTKEFQTYCKEQGIECRPYESFLEDMIHYKGIGKVWIDRKMSTYAVVEALEHKVKILNKVSPTVLGRAVKHQVEQEHMKNVYIQDSVILTKFLYWLHHNPLSGDVTEYTAGAYLDSLRKEANGFLDYSFDTICAYEENGAMMHYKAEKETCKTIESKGLLLVDSGAHYYGGTTDVTRTVALGPISHEAKLHATYVAIAMLRLQNVTFIEGCTGRNLDLMAREIMWKHHMDYKSGTGHGVGYMLGVHEGPQGIRYQYNQSEREAKLVEGMVVSNEPGVYLEGQYGIRTENIMVCKEVARNQAGTFLAFQPLTFVPIDLELMVESEFTTEDINNLNSYHAQVYEQISPYVNDREREWLKKVTRQL